MVKLRLTASELQRSAIGIMADADSLEIYCPNCRHHVAPLKAAVNWYCPRCAWHFTDAEIERQRAQRQSPEQPPSQFSHHLPHAAAWRLLPRPS
jgi:predicted RNA-binding Zn-ribbon protein involved in translation (DUF1610 family)